MDETFEILQSVNLEKIKEHLDNSYNKIIKYSQDNINRIIKLYNVCLNTNSLLNINITLIFDPYLLVKSLILLLLSFILLVKNISIFFVKLNFFENLKFIEKHLLLNYYKF